MTDMEWLPLSKAQGEYLDGLLYKRIGELRNERLGSQDPISICGIRREARKVFAIRKKIKRMLEKEKTYGGFDCRREERDRGIHCKVSVGESEV